ncbi:multicopper oxidase family protein [Acidicapsa acidisoli]|uniref:multicopper oxidase family protein n=1 Tax=Acidicapsa acidisoli TaxID=1615681 RepID=UPI0021E09A06|nr:multicopper oxidase family protein [Acidicapsa acidisoli]
MFTRRSLLKLGGMAAASAALSEKARTLASADYTLDIAPYTVELSPKHSIRTVAYNQQIPGPLLRFKEGQQVTIDVTNHSASEEIVHWHGLFTPSDVDGAMEEGTPMIPAGGKASYTLSPSPAGFRWYHTHTFAGEDLKKGQYTGLHGHILIDPANSSENPGHFDQEIHLTLHDWDGEMIASGDGSMNPVYKFASINGRLLGSGDPLRVKKGQRVLLHILNSSATEQHWIALAGHQFRVIALDGNSVPNPQSVPMLRLVPAERVCAIVEMNNPGVWVLGEVRKHIQAAGLGIVVEYANSNGKPVWQQPESLLWNYHTFAAVNPASVPAGNVIDIPLVFESRFAGHGAPDHWMINGKSWPNTETISLTRGQRYRLKFKNTSSDDHPVHLHRHNFEIRSLPGNPQTQGVIKDVVLVEAKTDVDVEFTANNPGSTLFHCHQQNHMDEGFMMLFRYV